jgi:type I restriction enzyme S subunit
MKTVRIGDVTRLVNGFAFDSKYFNQDGVGMPLVRIRDVVRGSTNTYYSGEYAKDYVVQAGDLLIGMDGEFNIAPWRGRPSLLNQRVCKIAAIPGVTHDAYLGYRLTPVLKKLEDDTPFVTVKHLSSRRLQATRIELPPLSEQKRIAAILAKADRLRRLRRYALELSDTFLQSVFLEMFGDPVTNPMGLDVVRLQDVCTRITDGTHQPPEWSDDGYPFLFVSNVVDGELNFRTRKFISHKTWVELTTRCPIELNDILYTTVGSYGNAALVRTRRRFSFQRHIAHIKPDKDEIHPEFLLGMLQSPGVRIQADREVRGVAQKTLNLRELKEFTVFRPTSKRQQEYVQVRRRIERLRAQQREAIRQADHLFDTLLHRAFRGEL